MFIVAIMSWSSVPAQIPIHWDISGQVDAYGSKFTGLLLLPLIALAGYTLIGLTAVFSPAQFEGRAMNALSWFRLTYVLIMAGGLGVVGGGRCRAGHTIELLFYSPRRQCDDSCG